MDYRELLEKYNALLEQVDRLTKENIRMRAQFGLPEPENIQKTISIKNIKRKIPDDYSADRKSFSDVDNQSDTFSKIHLFMSLFKGREDVYAKRWENKHKKHRATPQSVGSGWTRKKANLPKKTLMPPKSL